MYSYRKQLNSILSKHFETYSQNVQNPAVLLSGGIDSSLVSFFVSRYFKRYTVVSMGTAKTKDLPYVKIMSGFLSVPFTWVDLEAKIVMNSIPIVKRLLFDKGIPLTLMQISLASAYFFVFQSIKEMGISHVFTGQGPDVLFGGYHKYKSATDMNSEIKKDLTLLEIDKKRDNAMAKYFGLTLINPFLEQDVIDFAVRLPSGFKLKGGIEKYLLRALAKQYNLPEQIVNRPKKAFQYSTGIQAVLQKYAVAITE